VLQYLIEIWKESWTKKQLKELQRRINEVVLPGDVGSFGTKFAANISGLKAAELRLFFLSVALAVLDSDFLKPSEIKLIETFVTACRLIDVIAITEAQAREAHALFGKFVRAFAKLYGKERVTPNMHYHAHLCESIIDHGPFTGSSSLAWSSTLQQTDERSTFSSARPGTCKTACAFRTPTLRVQRRCPLKSASC
jgi:hypothetical protein